MNRKEEKVAIEYPDEVTVVQMGRGSGADGKYKVGCGNSFVILTKEQYIEAIRKTPDEIIEAAGYFPPSKIED